MFNDKERAVNRMHQLSCQVLFDSFLDTFVTWLQFIILKSCVTVQIVSLGMVSVGGKNWMKRKRLKTVALMSRNQTRRPLCIPQKQIQNYFLVVWILLAREFYMTSQKKRKNKEKKANSNGEKGPCLSRKWLINQQKTCFRWRMAH